MAFETITGPLVEPVTYSELAKQALIAEVDDAAEQALYDGFILAARRFVEAVLRKRLITQTVRVTLDGFEDPVCRGEIISLPVAPVQSIAEISYLDAGGAWQSLAAAEYRLISSQLPWRVAPAYGQTWPTPRAADFDTVRIDVRVGYGASPAEVPAEILHAIRFIAAYLNEHREEPDMVWAERAVRGMLSHEILHI